MSALRSGRRYTGVGCDLTITKGIIMKSIETTRMELFETWFKGCQQARLNRGFDEYTSWEVTLMTMAFNAALNLVEIELPKSLEYPKDYWDGVDDCKGNIEALNLGIKIK